MKTMKFLSLASALLAGLFTFSCTYPYDPEISTETERVLVVDGEILVGGESTLRLTYMTSLSDLSGNALHPQARGWIEDSEGNRYEPVYQGLTSTISIPTQEAVAGRKYRAIIEADGERYVSDWVKAHKAPTIKKIHFAAGEDYVSVYADVDAGKSQTGYMGFSYEETWHFHSDYIPDYLVNPTNWTYSQLMTTWPYYWCYRTVVAPSRVLLDYSAMTGSGTKNFQVTSFLRSDSRNHDRYSILIRAYSLSRDAYLYNKQMQELSDLGGDLFSPEPGMMQGNLVCETTPERKVFGLVLAAEVTEKRAFLDSRYLREPRQDDSFMISPETDEDKYNYYYIMNYRPIKYITLEGQMVMGWGPHRCTNCLEAGGTQERPDFWDEYKDSNE